MVWDFMFHKTWDFLDQLNEHCFLDCAAWSYIGIEFIIDMKFYISTVNPELSMTEFTQ